jgi:hypothetical protein
MLHIEKLDGDSCRNCGENPWRITLGSREVEKSIQQNVKDQERQEHPMPKF